MSDAVIQVDHVWKKFRKGEVHDSLRELIPAMFKRLTGRRPPKTELNNREFWALRDISFEVKRGESLGIIGPNGAGKSTMLKLLSRILKPNRGEYRINGRVSALIEVGAGFHADLTGRENIYLNGTILGMSKSEIKSKEEAIIDFSGVDSFIDTPVKRYSSGMTARLGFAVAAHMEPDVLLVDEVLSVGDARFRQKCIQHIKKLLSSEVTVIFISHILDQVRSLCPRTLVLDHGSIVYDGATDGAIVRYLDLLSTDTPSSQQGSTPVEIRNISLRDTHGEVTMQWQNDETNSVAFDLVLHETIEDLSVLINLSTVGDQYIGNINSRRDGVELPSEPGTYRLEFTLDPMPLCDADLRLDFKVNHRGGANAEVVWYSRQPRIVAIRGAGSPGGIVACNGKWKLNPPHDGGSVAPSVASPRKQPMPAKA